MANENTLLNLVQTDLAKGVVLSAQASSVIFNKIPFIEVKSNVYEYNVVSELLAPSFRDLGEEVASGMIAPITEIEQLKILSASVKTDRALTLYNNVTDIRVEQTNIAVASMIDAFEKQFFYGKGITKDFKGLSERVPQVGKVFDGVITGAKANVDTEMDLLDQALDYVKGSREENGFIFVSPATKRKLNKLCRNANIYATTEQFGYSVLVYDGVPVITIDCLADDDIFVVKFDQETGVTGLTCGGLNTIDCGLVGVNYVTDVEMLTAIACKTERSFAIIRPAKTK